MNWVNEYIGIPHQFGGRDRQGLDCYGLLKLVYEEQFGIELPDMPTGETLKERSKSLATEYHSGNWQALEKPVEQCVVVVKRAKGPHHIGIYLSGHVLHCGDVHGVTCEPLYRFLQRYPSIEFGVWTP